MYFRYKSERFKNKQGKEVTVKKPRIEIFLRKDSSPPNPSTNPEYRSYATVDSGADFTFIPKQIADILQLDLNEEKKEGIITVAGKSFAYRSEAYLEIMYKKNRVPIGFIEVLVTEGDASQPYIDRLFVLGRFGFFDKFEITFNESEQNFVLRRYHSEGKRY